MNKQSRNIDDEFVCAFRIIQQQVHETAKAKGFWPRDFADRNDGEMIALIHSELSEALEGIRHGNQPSDHIPDFSAAEEEFADAIIRMMDQAAGRNWRIAEAILAKMEFNARREHKHGKSF